MEAHFSGNVVVQWLTHRGDDRDMRLLQPFSFVDASQKEWLVPAGVTINGASIPRVIWTTFGPPFIGDYRCASVVHDYFCQVRTETPAATHRMFREACLAGGVSSARASIMYLAVRSYNRIWATLEAQLSIPQISLRGSNAAVYTTASKNFSTPGLLKLAAGVSIELITTMTSDDYTSLSRWIEKNDPTPDEIDARSDPKIKISMPVDISIQDFDGQL